MPPAKKKVKNKKARGIGVDFQKVKHKVGRKLLPASNTTKVEVKSKSIILPGQSVAQEKDGLAVSNRRQTLKELLMQTTHHNDNVRRDALLGIRDLLARHPNELKLHAITLVEKLCQRIMDKDKSVRQALLVLLRTSIFVNLPEVLMQPLVPTVMAHICSAMTHLAVNIRISAFDFLDAFIQNYPFLVSGYIVQIAQFYVDSLGKLGVNHTESQLAEVLDSLLRFLAAIHRKSGASNVIAATRDKELQGHLEDAANSPGGKKMMALHWYKSIWPQGRTPLCQRLAVVEENVKPLGASVLSLGMANALVQALLNCWLECAPLVCSGQAPDKENMECMIKICQALQMILLCMKPQLKAIHDKGANISYGTQMGCFNDADGLEVGKWIREVTIPLYSRHLMASFPIYAPPINLPRKVEELLIALNMAISDVMLVSIIAGSMQVENKNQNLTTLINFVEGTLAGKLLPSLGLSPDIVDKKTLEVYTKSLVAILPHLLYIVSIENQVKLLQAFTHVFQQCNSTSRLKHACLTCIGEILNCPLGANQEKTFLQSESFEFQRQWLQALPRLLWELKHNYPTSSLAVLKVVHHLGRTAPQNSPLSEEYMGLQPILIPFFSTISCARSDQGSHLRACGPFVKLPLECQQVAVDLLYYFGSFSSAFLKAIAHCLCSPDVQASLILRCVEVLQAAFCRGSIELSNHLSFLLTIILGPSSFETTTLSKVQTKLDKERLLEFQRQRVITGKVCSCLCQIGDGRLLMHLLSSLICQHMALPLPLVASYGLVKVVAVLNGFNKGLLVPKPLSEALPPFLAAYLVSMCAESCFKERGLKGEPSLKSMIQSCLHLIASDGKLTESVVRQLFTSLHVYVSTEDTPHVCGTAISLLQILCMQPVHNKIFQTQKEMSVLNKFQLGPKGICAGSDELLVYLERLGKIVSSAYGWPESSTKVLRS